MEHLHYVDDAPFDFHRFQQRRRTLSDARRASLFTIFNEDADVKIDSRTLRVGNLGRGINILDGSLKFHIMSEIRANYYPTKSEREKLHFFQNNFEFSKELASRLGLGEIEPGMFSLWNGDFRENMPFLSTVDKIDGFQHLILELEETYYTLSMMSPSNNQLNFMDEDDIKFILSNGFNKDTKPHYYAVIEKYGTHYIKRAVFGAKAEIRWSFSEKVDKDAISKVTALQKYKKRLLAIADRCRELKWNMDLIKKEEEKLPKNCTQLRRATHNYTFMSHEDRVNHAEQVRFEVAEISTLFSGQTRLSMETAVKVYLEEMRPKKDVSALTDDAVICIYCIDTGKYVRVDQHGHLFADSVKLESDSQFRVKKKGTRIALKSLKFKDKFISKALISNKFVFHRLQFMGPHESFEFSEEFVKACGNMSGPSFIYVNPEDRQLFHDGHVRKKNRFCILDAQVRSAVIEELDDFEPTYIEDDMTIDIKVESAAAVPHKKPDPSSAPPNFAKSLFAKAHGKEITKSNSTSSLFIKDTILLPNIDELTRCMGFKLQQMILEGSKKRNDGRPVDIFSEEHFPLTRHANIHTVPSVETIFHFLNTIFKVAKLSAEAGIMAMIYIHRLLDKTRINIQPSNWRRLVLSTLILASKVWEDQAVWNVDFIELFPNISVKDLNRLEQHLLNFLEFSVSIKASEYVKTYFELREFSSNKSDRDGFVRPIDESDLKKLEVRTASSEKEYEQQIRFHKSSSMDTNAKTPGTPGGFGILS